VVEHGQVLVVGSRHPAVLDALAASEGRWIVDLVRLPDAAVRRGGDRYLGIAW
jgi:GDP-mannose 6-dehydrogenase